jgi:prepilin-type processing-associated H-X9-DG protein
MNGTVTITQTDTAGLFSPLKLPQLSKIIFIADSGGNVLPMPMVYYNISDAIRYKGIAFRHRGAVHDSAKDYVSQQQIVKEAGTANFLFFDGHAEPLTYLDITDLMRVPLPQ